MPLKASHLTRGFYCFLGPLIPNHPWFSNFLASFSSLNSTFWYGFFFPVCWIMWPPFAWEGRFSPYLFHPCQLRAPGSGRLDSPLDRRADLTVSSSRSWALFAVRSQVPDSPPRLGAALHESETAATFIRLLLCKETGYFIGSCENKNKVHATLNTWA